MPRSDVPYRSRQWPRFFVLAMIATGAAGCSESGRWDIKNPFASSDKPAQGAQDVTGSIASRPAPAGKVETQALPAPSRPETVAANGGVAQGAQGLGTQGLGAYRPSSSDITGSVSAPRAVSPPAPVGHWSWEGGTPITVMQGDTVDIIGRKYGVPASAIMQANGIGNSTDVKPGQRLVIPRYTVAAPAPQPMPQVNAPQVSAPQVAPAKPIATKQPAVQPELVHVVVPGESLIGIAKHYKVPLKALASANKIEPYAKVNMGDRLTIPGHRAAPAQQASAQKIEPPRTVPAQQQASANAPATQSARMATPEPATHESPAKIAEATGSMPSFRWPVRGRIITAFGAKTNGQQNDGINLAVPEGTPVKAAEDGVVAYAGNELKGYGNLVLVRHSNGYVSAYANASELMVKRGDTVKRGQTIARAGQTGNVTSPQLHFEIRKGSTPVDPAQYLTGGNG